MLRHVEQKKLPFTPEKMFDLVAAVDRYVEFAPWCAASRIRGWEGDHVFHADLVVGYKMFRETFSSRVILDRPYQISIEYVSGPMKSLTNQWRFTREPDGSCMIDFVVEFSFKNKLFQGLVDVFFNEVVKRMVSAFEARAHALYGVEPSKAE
jgi:coenzyme Q-binding protein COQ10